MGARHDHRCGSEVRSVRTDEIDGNILSPRVSSYWDQKMLKRAAFLNPGRLVHEQLR